MGKQSIRSVFHEIEIFGSFLFRYCLLSRRKAPFFDDEGNKVDIVRKEFVALFSEGERRELFFVRQDAEKMPTVGFGS